VIPFAALSGPLPKLGVVAVAALAGVTLTLGADRRRAFAMLGALVLAPVLLLADIWHYPQLREIHHHPLIAAVAAVIALAAVAALAVVIARRPALFGPLAVAALPFRIPIGVASNTSNLLVPLYLVVAAGTLAWVVPLLWRERAGSGPALAGAGGSADDAADPRWHAVTGWLERLLAVAVVLYAVQAVYSSDFDKALQQMVFFYVPFALMFALLRDLRWDRQMVTRCLIVTVALAVVFACVGFAEYETKTIFLNPKLVAANSDHAYFTVNSVFFDPDIFGRFLALVMITLVAVLIYDARPRIEVGVTVVLAILWGGLVLTLSRSSLAALLLGMAALAAMRWKLRPVLIAAGIVVVLGAGALAISPKTFGLNQGLNGASSGRANLVTGGLDLFGDRPVWGYGSGAFSTQYERHGYAGTGQLTASHTIVITIAAEQGVIGELVYIPLIVIALITLLRGAGADPRRAAVGAAFLALVLHTELYADFLEDPVTWTLLGIGASLAGARALELAAERAEEQRLRRAAAV
jgi:O-antigen ligase